jgi:hypothetical protein
MRSSTFRLGALLMGGMALVAACGGDGGGPTSTIGGNVSSASTSAIERARPSWLARLERAGQELIGLARQAIAQGPGELSGIVITARGAGDTAKTVTSSDGTFRLAGAPTGDVTVHMHRDSCDAEATLGDVASSSTVTLEDVSFDCSTFRAAKIAETVRGVVKNKPGSSNGNLNLCVATGDGTRTRVVKLQGASFEDASGGASSFEALQEGDQIEAEGAREGLGAPSALDADVVRILGPGSLEDCIVEAPTPTATTVETPTATPEPTATATS